MSDNSELHAKNFSCFSGCRVSVGENAVLKLGNGYFNHEVLVVCNKLIEIGDDCAIAQRVVIRDSNAHMIDRDGYKKTAPIKIGNHVWIASNAIILPGVTIGDGSMIAAGSVVNRDIPPNSLAAGVPAKVVRSNIKWY